eukprot:SAG31_NODE_2569_length_5461_cov_6.801007_4_plen_110_part_00
MATFTTAQYTKKRKKRKIDFECLVGDRVEVLFWMPGPVYYAGIITKVTPTRCKVLFDTDQSEWDMKRYGEEAQLIRKITEEEKKKKQKKKKKEKEKEKKVVPSDFDDDL